MRRMLMVCAATLLALAPATVGAQSGTGDSKKTLSASGTVSAVSATSLTLKDKAAELTFAIDSETRVIMKGATQKKETLKDDKKQPVLTEFVKVGDTVTVKYRDTGTAKQASEVRLVGKGTLAK